MAAMDDMTWAEALPACELDEARVWSVSSLTLFFVSSSVPCSHFPCSSWCRATSRAVKAFLRAIPAAARMAPCADSLASSCTSVAR